MHWVGGRTVTSNLLEGGAALQNLQSKIILVNGRVNGHPLVSVTIDLPIEVLSKFQGQRRRLRKMASKRRSVLALLSLTSGEIVRRPRVITDLTIGAILLGRYRWPCNLVFAS